MLDSEIIPSLYLCVTLNNIVIFREVCPGRHRQAQVFYKDRETMAMAQLLRVYWCKIMLNLVSKTLQDKFVHLNCYSFQLRIPPFSLSYLCGDRELGVLYALAVMF